MIDLRLKSTLFYFYNKRAERKFKNVDKLKIDIHNHNIFELMSKVFKQIQKIVPTSKIDIFGPNSLMNSTLPYYLLTLTAVIATMSGI